MVGVARWPAAHGTLARVDFAELDLALALTRLPAPEQERALALPESRRREYVAGRFALHHLLDDFDVPVVADERGAPQLPPGFAGSISHKQDVAVALLAPVEQGGVGVDIELARAPRIDIASRILTPRELASVPDRELAVTLRFSIKEAIYKAIAPTLGRYVGFQEVELELDGEHCRVTSALPFHIEAAWARDGSWLIATARARAR